jgi:hypothetical protein
MRKPGNMFPKGGQTKKHCFPGNTVFHPFFLKEDKGQRKNIVSLPCILANTLSATSVCFPSTNVYTKQCIRNIVYMFNDNS